MTTRGFLLKSSFINSNAPINNGIGRYVPQLARITLKFCKSHGGSAGARRFIEEDIVEFAKKNPGTVVYLKPRRHRSPVLVAEYLNGERFHQSLDNYSKDEVAGYFDMYKGYSGVVYSEQSKNYYSDHPSIQGYWNPMTHKSPDEALARFPHEVPAVDTEQSATDIIRQMFASQQKSEGEFSVGEEERLTASKQGEGGGNN